MSKRAKQAALNAFPVIWSSEDRETRWDVLEGKRICFELGYNQAEKETIEMALKWMRNHIDNYFECYSDICQFMRDFEKAMEK